MIDESLKKKESSKRTNLKRIKKDDLLKLMYKQNKKIDEQQIEINELKKEINSRHIVAEKAGSLAEAAVRITNVFEEAQLAADMYLNNIMSAEEKTENVTMQAIADIYLQIKDINRRMDNISEDVMQLLKTLSNYKGK